MFLQQGRVSREAPDHNPLREVADRELVVTPQGGQKANTKLLARTLKTTTTTTTTTTNNEECHLHFDSVRGTVDL